MAQRSTTWTATRLPFGLQFGLRFGLHLNCTILEYFAFLKKALAFRVFHPYFFDCYQRVSKALHTGKTCVQQELNWFVEVEIVLGNLCHQYITGVDVPDTIQLVILPGHWEQQDRKLCIDPSLGEWERKVWLAAYKLNAKKYELWLKITPLVGEEIIDETDFEWYLEVEKNLDLLLSPGYSGWDHWTQDPEI